MRVNTEDCKEEQSLAISEEYVDLKNYLVEAREDVTVNELAEAYIKIREHGTGKKDEKDTVTELLRAGTFISLN